MGLAIMVIGLAVFLGSHTLVTLRPQRAALIARLLKQRGVKHLVNAYPRACLRSAIRSFASSSPTETRTVPGVTPQLASSWALIW